MILINERALVICESLMPEVEKIVPPEIRIKVLELGLHDYPEKLHRSLDAALVELEEERDWQLIVLGYGLCGKGTVGLQTRNAKLVVPKVDDCIALFLGSRSAFREQAGNAPGTYYFTKGWLKADCGPLAMYEGKHVWTKKYSKEKAEYIAREMMKNYTRIALIDTGAYELAPYEAQARQTARVFNLKYEQVPGTLEFITTLIYGPWDERFIVVEPGHEITDEMFA